MNHFYNSYFPNHNRAFHINNLQKGVEKNLPGVEGVDFAERGRSTPKGVGVGRSAIHLSNILAQLSFSQLSFQSAQYLEENIYEESMII